jgi:hypothetical protein
MQRKWTAYKKAMACCEFIRDNHLGPDAKWYVQNVMLPLIGMTKTDVTESITGDEALNCFRQALSGAAFFRATVGEGLTYNEYCTEQWYYHLDNLEHIRKTIGSLIWICQHCGMALPWSNEISWVQDFERVAKELENTVKWEVDEPNSEVIWKDTEEFEKERKLIQDQRRRLSEDELIAIKDLFD